jgi:hypothetical protein
VASNDRLAHYGYNAHRGRKAIEQVRILPQYWGTTHNAKTGSVEQSAYDMLIVKSHKPLRDENSADE